MFSQNLILLVLLNIICYTNGIAYNSFILEEACEENGTVLDLTRTVSTYGKIYLTRGEGYSMNMDCSVRIQAPPEQKLVIRFYKIEIYKKGSSCGTDFVSLSGETNTFTLCGYGTPPSAYVSTTRSITIRFKSSDAVGPGNTRQGFRLYYTSFTEAVDEQCYNNTFKCKTRTPRCIPGELTCDRHDNCGDWSDERASVCGMAPGTVAVIVIIVLIAGGSCVIGIGYYACRKPKRNRQSPQTASVTGVPAPTVVTANYYRGRSNRNTNEPEPPPPYTMMMDPMTDLADKGPLPPAYDNIGFQRADLTVDPTDNTADQSLPNPTHNRSNANGVATIPVYNNANGMNRAPNDGTPNTDSGMPTTNVNTDVTGDPCRIESQQAIDSTPQTANETSGHIMEGTDSVRQSGNPFKINQPSGNIPIPDASLTPVDTESNPTVIEGRVANNETTASSL